MLRFFLYFFGFPVSMERYLTDSEYYLNLKGIGLSRVKGEAREATKRT